jgi:DNA-binding response OmpR family regulator
MPEKILIVDDDLETLRLIGVMLQRQGYEIAAANTGEMAVSMAKKENPDLIVLDIMMPVMDGYRVAKEIRQDPDTAQIPILMFTAKSQVDDKIAGYDAGADDYLTKPVHPAELSAHVKSLLARSARTEVPVVVEAPGHVIGITGCKGGLGASTLALNLAVEYFNVSKKEVLAIELRREWGAGGLNWILLTPMDWKKSSRLLLKKSQLKRWKNISYAPPLELNC